MSACGKCTVTLWSVQSPSLWIFPRLKPFRIFGTVSNEWNTWDVAHHLHLYRRHLAAPITWLMCCSFFFFSDEECVKQGVEFVPVRLRQKKRPRDTDNGMGTAGEGGSKHKQKGKQKQDSGIWAPSSSEGESSDSEDSMSDLYPCKQCFISR